MMKREGEGLAPDARHVGLLFFASGAAGLIYEVSWSRQVGLRLGQTAQAGAVVLSGYFTGLAIGSAIGARLARRVRPLRGYGVAELIAALGGLLVPVGLDLIDRYPTGRPARAVACFALLLPTTIALGVTLPMLAEYLSPRRGVATGRVARIYAMNTAGALAGVVIASAALLVFVGVRGSGTLAAAISAACGLAAIAIDRSPIVSAPRTGVEPSERTAFSVSHLGPWTMLAALSGFGTLAVQVLMARMFALTFHNSTYTFGLVVAGSLAGLAMGSILFARLQPTWGPERLLIIGCGAGSAALAGSVLAFVGLTGLEYFRFGIWWFSYMIGAAALVSAIVIPPTTMFGLVLPACWGAARAEGGGGAVVGRLTAINAVAAAVGAPVAGFLALPTIGLWASFGLVAGSFGAAAVALRFRERRPITATGLFATLVILIAGGVIVPSQVSTLPPGTLARIEGRWEGPYGLIEVIATQPGTKVLRQDLHYGLGSSGSSSTREYRQGLLPLLFHRDPKDVLFLGLGTGLTSGASLLHPGVDRIEVVELIPEVIEAARHFDPENFGVVDHPKVAVIVDDARHRLRSTSSRYDVIVSDLFIPWESRAGYLYTVDFYRVVHDRLRGGGLFCQWLPLYQLGREEFEQIADGFASVFPRTTLWWGRLSSETGMIAMVGSDELVTLHAVAIDEILFALRPALDDPETYLASGALLSRLYAGDWPAPHSQARLNSDEHPWIEFRAPIRHGDARLLVGDRLLSLFDESFARLSSGSVELIVDADHPPIRPHERRAWQRGALIGEEPR